MADCSEDLAWHRMDAKVVMELYKHCILSDPSQLSEEEMLDGYLAQVL